MQTGLVCDVESARCMFPICRRAENENAPFGQSALTRTRWRSQKRMAQANRTLTSRAPAMPMRGQPVYWVARKNHANLLCLEEDLHDPSKFGPKDGRDDAARQGGGRAAGEGSIEGKVPLGPAGGAACFACMKKPKRPVDSQMFTSAERRADLPRAAPPREVGSPFAGLVAIGDARVAGRISPPWRRALM